MNLSHASYNDSESCCMKDVMSFLNFVILVGGKYLERNLIAVIAQVVMDPTGNDCNHPLAISFREYGNILRRTDSSDPLL